MSLQPLRCNDEHGTTRQQNNADAGQHGGRLQTLVIKPLRRAMSLECMGRNIEVHQDQDTSSSTQTECDSDNRIQALEVENKKLKQYLQWFQFLAKDSKMCANKMKEAGKVWKRKSILANREIALLKYKLVEADHKRFEEYVEYSDRVVHTTSDGARYEFFKSRSAAKAYKSEKIRCNRFFFGSSIDFGKRRYSL